MCAIQDAIVNHCDAISAARPGEGGYAVAEACHFGSPRAGVPFRPGLRPGIRSNEADGWIALVWHDRVAGAMDLKNRRRTRGVTPPIGA
jgi:hypothetical protein